TGGALLIPLLGGIFGHSAFLAGAAATFFLGGQVANKVIPGGNHHAEGAIGKLFNFVLAPFSAFGRIAATGAVIGEGAAGSVAGVHAVKNSSLLQRVWGGAKKALGVEEGTGVAAAAGDPSAQQGTGNTNVSYESQSRFNLDISSLNKCNVTDRDVSRTQ